MSQDDELSKTNYTFRMTKKERETLEELGKLEGSESNAIRRSLRLLMQARGLDIPEGVFADKESGNRLPKSAALSSVLPSRACA